MYRLWGAIVEPLPEAARPKSMVEIGSERGPNTRNLLEFCKRTGATLHAVDPASQFDVAELRERYGESFVFHQALSLEAHAVGAETDRSDLGAVPRVEEGPQARRQGPKDETREP